MGGRGDGVTRALRLLGLLLRELLRVQPTIYRVKGKAGGQWYGWEER